jgi:hypothetical protein
VYILAAEEQDGLIRMQDAPMEDFPESRWNEGRPGPDYEVRKDRDVPLTGCPVGCGSFFDMEDGKYSVEIDGFLRDVNK